MPGLQHSEKGALRAISVRFSDRGFDRAEKRLARVGLDVMRESASAMQEDARDRAPVDTGELKNSITLVPTEDGAVVRVLAEHGIWLEYGTGIHAEGGGGRKTPWVYKHPRWGWVFTRGGHPQPYMRPAFPAGVARFYEEKRRRGL